MASAARRKRRVTIAVLCCLPTLLLAAVWGVGAGTSILSPGRALPERSTVGIAGRDFHVYTASSAVEFEDLAPADRPPQSPAERGGPWGRHFTESTRAGGVIGVNRGVEWHGTFATYFTHVAIPMWLPLLCTLPLLVVAGWQVVRVRASTRARREARCVNCGHALKPSDPRCPECGRAVPSVDAVGQVFLAAGGPAESAGAAPRKAK